MGGWGRGISWDEVWGKKGVKETGVGGNLLFAD